MTSYLPINLIQQAKKSFGDVIPTTPLEYSARLSKAYGAEIYLKREDLQIVRSYKIRGAFNCISSLSKEEKDKWVVCASAWNHAQGVAFTCHALKVHWVIFTPKTTPEQKVYKTRKFWDSYVEVVLVGDTFDDAYKASREYEKEHGAVFVHPFDDPRVIAGQWTVGLEIIDQLPRLPDHIIAPIGGGGLVSGLISAMHALSPDTKVIGVEPAGAASMYHSLQNGENTTLDTIETFVDGAAVKRVGEATFSVTSEYGLSVYPVPENRVCSTMLEYLREEGIVTEPAGALATDALKDMREMIHGKTVVVIISGGNFDFERLPEVKERSMKYEGTKKYMLVNFPQRPGALKEFLNILGAEDDIARFEYLKKTNKAKAPALIGIETTKHENFEALFARMSELSIQFKDVTDDPLVYDLIV